MKNEIKTPAAPQAIGPYSQAIEVNNLVFISGQIAMDPETGELRSGSIEEETRLVLANLKGIVEAAGCSVSNIVKCTVFLKDLGDYAGMNRVYGDFFTPPFPARVALQVARLPKDARVEIEAIAIK
jgi:2-iminobutanoate/2-iminopropanoate deaminase